MILPEPSMTLHIERTIDTRMVAWPAQRLTSNDNQTKRLYDADKVRMWRGLGAKAFQGVPPIPPGHVARVVVHYRQPPGRGKVRDISNLHKITKCLVDGASKGADGKGTGPWPDDSTKHVLGQDERELLPSTHLEVVVQVWVAPR